MKRAFVSLVALAVCVLVPVRPAAAAADARSVGTLGVGEQVFWDGAYVEKASVADAGGCDVVAPCFEYRLRIANGGYRLRVAVDTPSREDTFSFTIDDPKGVQAGGASNSNQFNEEAFVAKPAPGTWTVKVVPTNVDKASFRMRARLEAKPASRPAKVVEMRPNLRSVPPYEFGFVAPANPFNGVYPPDTANPPLDVLGTHPASCASDEMAEDGVRRCLRLTAGPMNAGAGPFEMRFRHIDDVAAGAPPTIFQAVHLSNGKTKVRTAGTYSYHKTHAHYHYDDILTYELFSVGRGGALERAGKGNKSGFCPADQLFADWRSFGQAPSGSYGEGDSAGGDCFSSTNGLLGLSAGWGDIYRWQRPGQYVDFGTNGDGHYVVRTWVDKLNHVLESDETDNVSYALIHVVGDSVRILERGRGSGPRDPDKIVHTGAGPSAIS